MERFYAQFTTQTAQDNDRLAVLTKLTRLSRRQLQVLVNEYVWHNW